MYVAGRPAVQLGGLKSFGAMLWSATKAALVLTALSHTAGDPDSQMERTRDGVRTNDRTERKWRGNPATKSPTLCAKVEGASLGMPTHP